MPWVEPVTLTGRYVRLEPLEARHAPGLLAAADPELFRFTPQAPPEWSAAGFEHEIRRVTALPGVLAFAVIRLPTPATGDSLPQRGPEAASPAAPAAETVIGRTTYMEIRPERRGLEIGRTWIGRAHQGTRVNPEMKLLMLRHAFETLAPPAIRVQFTTDARNQHSQAAIAKLGALREGTLRADRLLEGGAVGDTVIFSITAAEWPAVRQSLEQRLGGTG